MVPALVPRPLTVSEPALLVSCELPEGRDGGCVSLGKSLNLSEPLPHHGLSSLQPRAWGLGHQQ